MLIKTSTLLNGNWILNQIMYWTRCCINIPYFLVWNIVNLLLYESYQNCVFVNVCVNDILSKSDKFEIFIICFIIVYRFVIKYVGIVYKYYKENGYICFIVIISIQFKTTLKLLVWLQKLNSVFWK